MKNNWSKEKKLTGNDSDRRDSDQFEINFEDDIDVLKFQGILF